MSAASPGRMVAALATVGALVAGCSSPPSRSEVVDAVTEEVVQPAYAMLAAATADLAEATDQLCVTGGPDDLAAARDAVAAARVAWKSTEAMWLGPVMDRRSWALVDWPVEPDEVEALIAGPEPPLDPETLRTTVGADQRGLGALEHVLYRDGPGTLDALEDPRRCEYVLAVARVIDDEAQALASAWSGADGPASADADMAIDDLVQDAVFLLEGITHRELSAALGLTGAPDPDALLEGPGGLGLADLEARLAGLRAVLLGAGAGSTGLGPLLSDETEDRLTAAFDEAEAAVAVVEPPLGEAVRTDAATVARALDAIDEIEVIVATEVVSGLGVTVGFSDADGDSSG